MPLNYEYPIKILSPSTFKVYSIIVLQMKKSKVKCEWIELSFNQIAMKTGMSYGTISKCVDELGMHGEIIEVNKRNGVTTAFRLNTSIII